MRPLGCRHQIYAEIDSRSHQATDRAKEQNHFEAEPARRVVMERRSNRVGGIPANCQYLEYKVEIGTPTANSHHRQQPKTAQTAGM